jgi:hypothetical protein
MESGMALDLHSVFLSGMARHGTRLVADRGEPSWRIKRIEAGRNRATSSPDNPKRNREPRPVEPASGPTATSGKIKRTTWTMPDDNRPISSINPAQLQKEVPMAHKKKHKGTIPPDNQPQVGPSNAASKSKKTKADTKGGAPFQEQDVKRRIGNFEGAGEHAYQQPGGNNDANR